MISSRRGGFLCLISMISTRIIGNLITIKFWFLWFICDLNEKRIVLGMISIYLGIISSGVRLVHHLEILQQVKFWFLWFVCDLGYPVENMFGLYFYLRDYLISISIDTLIFRVSKKTDKIFMFSVTNSTSIPWYLDDSRMVKPKIPIGSYPHWSRREPLVSWISSCTS